MTHITVSARKDIMNPEYQDSQCGLVSCEPAVFEPVIFSQIEAGYPISPQIVVMGVEFKARRATRPESTPSTQSKQDCDFRKRRVVDSRESCQLRLSCYSV